MSEYEDGFRCERDDDVVSVELLYPRSDGRPKHVIVGMECTRATDGFRTHYDFDRDGWVIEQASRFSFADGEEIDPGWKEVAFVKSWAMQEDGDEDL